MRVDPGVQSKKQLAATGYIGACSGLAQQTNNRRMGVGLDSIADERLVCLLGGRIQVSSAARHKIRAAIDISGRFDGGGDSRKRHVLAI